MSVWYAIPSARPPEQAEQVLKLWRERRYKIGLWLDRYEAEMGQSPESDFCIVSKQYPGYSAAVNALCSEILKIDPCASWIVTGGDDVHPDPNHSAEQIAAECTEHFLGFSGHLGSGPLPPFAGTFGVMQPTGDRWGEHDVSGLPGAYIDRVCGSPWLGREFCRRMYGGQGPLFCGYQHMYEDEELFEVARKLGVLWQRPDLTHYHEHWARKPGTTMDACPEFLRAANSDAAWREAKTLYESRKLAGFPGHEPIA